MKRWYAVIMVVLFVAFAATVFAYGPRGGGYGPGACGGTGGGFGGMAANLNLTQEQQDKTWQVQEKFRNDTSAVRYEMFKKRAELRNLYADPNTNDAAILAKQKEVNILRQSMQDKAVQFKLAQRKILTPEQIKKIGESGYGQGMGRGYGQSRGIGMGGRGQSAGTGAGPCVQ